MAKTPIKYYEIDPWKVIEKGFLSSRSEASESIFSLSNEYMGVRGFFDETYSGKSLIGTYFNGIYEVPVKEETGGYKGISHKSHFMVNSVNWLKTSININDEEIDLNKIIVSDFTRELSFKSGELKRTFIYKDVKFTFYRLLDMVNYHQGCQKIIIEPLNNDIHLKLSTGLDYQIKHWGKYRFWKVDQIIKEKNNLIIEAHTKKTKQRLLTNVYIDSNDYQGELKTENQNIVFVYDEIITKNKPFILTKIVNHLKEKDISIKTPYLLNTLNNINKDYTYDEIFNKNLKYWQKIWDEYDILINGDPSNQQGIRFCIFKMQQTIQGIDPTSNIGAKGLTGEAYSGHAFWDTETCCLPFFLLNNPPAAKDLLMFRYHTLPQAKLRAIELDCKGACYPIATLNGNEACSLWQHASLQFQPTTGVCYGIYHYVNLTNDLDFLYHYGIEMLIEASRFLASRGDYNSDHTCFGFYNVMGPDEFQMMVNHNTYTNYMAKRSIEYTLQVLKQLQKDEPITYQTLIDSLKITNEEIIDLTDKVNHMKILYDESTLLYEQHHGYFDLPHIDINKIPITDFPLYEHWSYDHLYRNDMIKQPDVLMMMYLYNQSFTYEQKLANYNYYEPRTIHESSLSPSIHSILALELGKIQEGLAFFGYATRMDLDDYNRNTKEGIHTTSIASAWANIVYGFGGIRTDGEILKIAPVIPNTWDMYQFKIKYHDSLIKITVNKENVLIETNHEVTLKVYSQVYTIKSTLSVNLP